ncbi:MAG: exodeoxyribonuclease I [Ralstonia sp.]|uniref:Exodeoxyribonuclease I n=3 Tax=root TaxID=1 RepID=A0A2P4RFM8_RALPI|nr:MULTISPECIES: exodeoxyribonuclease I [Ralstonia]MBA4232286.1 exodeoxyribonuclease I [Ralstonia sp.]MBA4236386.1 exodeoxyribonuclease I [Ralstonia sp.]MBA4279250.1 exodeoxyribonuclease I [Ralstonia sp.]MBA4295502.1 exodeoxyribonuclease I [Ralstonia sp.]MBA9847841.1 exodeoxyribonuclease I [Ralstonia pickettii]
MPATPSFLWHDYETFGAVPRRDRPAQFAGIRTDAELNEIGEPVELFCQPSNDWLPDPVSCLITGITPQQCARQGIPEYRFAQAIERELGTPGTIGVGYNTIRFDDEVTRHLFWRNLIDPYAREWQNECGRWDLLDVVRTTWALRPEGIQWPTHEDGRPSFKLEHLSKANGLVHEAAHDAVSDVRATIALARLIRNAQPRLFDFCLALRKKDRVAAEIGDAPRPLLHISGMYGVERGCMAVVWPLGGHPTNKNELIVWDLAFDPSELFDMDVATIRERMFTRAADLAEGTTRLPIKSIHINKSPIVISNMKTLQPGQAERWGIDFATIERHAAIAQGAPDMRETWRQVYARELEPIEDVDQNLYGGFVGNEDRRLLNELRTLSGEQLARLHAEFADARLPELLFRYRARNFPDTLNEEEYELWEQLRAERLFEGRDGYMTFETFGERLQQLGAEAEENGDTRAQTILQDLYDYAQQIVPG